VIVIVFCESELNWFAFAKAGHTSYGIENVRFFLGAVKMETLSCRKVTSARAVSLVVPHNACFCRSRFLRAMPVYEVAMFFSLAWQPRRLTTALLASEEGLSRVLADKYFNVFRRSVSHNILELSVIR